MATKTVTKQVDELTARMVDAVMHSEDWDTIAEVRRRLLQGVPEEALIALNEQITTNREARAAEQERAQKTAAKTEAPAEEPAA